MEEVDEFQRVSKRNRRTGNNVVLGCLGLVLLISYVLKNEVECAPRLDEWLYRTRIILLVIFLGGMSSWVNFGLFITNAGKICKIFGVVCVTGYGFVGVYLMIYDESCLKVWPLGFYTVMVIACIPILYLIVCCVMLGCILGEAYIYKDKDS